MAQCRQARRQIDLSEPRHQLGGRDQRIAGMLVDLLAKQVAVERVVQRQRAARQQPEHERGSQARER